MKEPDMRQCTCPTCNTAHIWTWEEAFLRDGFYRGEDSQTETVADFLRAKGYAVDIDDTLEGNPFIQEVLKRGAFHSDYRTHAGETDPRDHLPPHIVQLLDAEYPETPQTPADRAHVAEQTLNRFAHMAGTSHDHTTIATLIAYIGDYCEARHLPFRTLLEDALHQHLNATTPRKQQR